MCRTRAGTDTGTPVSAGPALLRFPAARVQPPRRATPAARLLLTMAERVTQKRGQGFLRRRSFRCGAWCPRGGCQGLGSGWRGCGHVGVFSCVAARKRVIFTPSRVPVLPLPVTGNGCAARIPARRRLYHSYSLSHAPHRDEQTSVVTAALCGSSPALGCPLPHPSVPGCPASTKTPQRGGFCFL